MKKLIFVFAVSLGYGLFATSCSTTKAASSVASMAGLDVNSLTSGLMGSLTPSLGLSAAQKPGVTSAITDFLTKKSGIMGLATSNPVKYASQASSLFGGLKSKLGGVLTGAQLTKFMSLKPSTNDATNVLSNLFY